MSSNITIPSNDAPSGATLSVTVSDALPQGVVITASNAKVLASFTLEASATVTMSTAPKIAATLGSSPQNNGQFYVWESNTKDGTWNDLGTLTVSGAQLAFGGSGKPLVLQAGVKYAIIPFTAAPLQVCPTPPPPTPTPAPTSTPLAVQDCFTTGATAIGILCYSSHAYAFVPKGGIGSTTISQVQVDGTSPPRHFTASFQPTECAGDQVDVKVFCAGVDSNKVAVIDPVAGTESEFSTIAGGSVSFTDGSCTICGIVFNPSNHAVILGDAHSGSMVGFFDLYGTATHELIKTISPENGIGENFGYDYRRNNIYSSQTAPQSSTPRRVYFINVEAPVIYFSANDFGQADFSPLDANAMDAVSKLGMTVEEGSSLGTTVVFLTDLDRPFSGQFGPRPPAGPVSIPDAQNILKSTTLTATCAAHPVPAIAIDSPSHIMVTDSERCAHGPVGAVQLPPEVGAGGAITNYVFATIPDVGGFSPFVSGGAGPHGIAAFDDPVCRHCGVLMNADASYIIVVDLPALLNVPREADDSHSADPSFDLVGNHVLTFHGT